MRFKNEQELSDVLRILSEAYNEHHSVIEIFQRSEYTLFSGERCVGIVFKGLWFSNPCLDLTLLSDYGIIKKDLLDVGKGGKEINQVAISWANLKLLRKLSLPLNGLDLAHKLMSLGYRHELIGKKEIIRQDNPGRIRESLFVTTHGEEKEYKPSASELADIFGYL